MNLILHIARKDFRQSWPILAATVALFVLTTRTLSASPQPRNSSADLETVVLAAWMISTGVLWLREPLPGQRAYWLARPIRWPDLLQAKTLVVIVAIFLPILATHAVILASNGLPVAPNLPSLTWNAAVIVALHILPVAALATISRNLQQLILWVLALFGAGILASLAHQVSPETDSLASTVTNALSIVAFGAILVWQYRTRSTRAGRIAVVALTIFVRTLPIWVPDSAWFAFQRAFSPAHPVQLAVGPGSEQGRTVSIRFDGLGPGETAVITAVHGDAIFTIPPRPITDTGPREVTVRHSLHSSVTAELTVYGPPLTIPSAIGESIEIPGFGRCRSSSDGYLRILCNGATTFTGRLDAQWSAGTLAADSPSVLTYTQNRTVLVPILTPVLQAGGGSTTQSVYSNGRVFFSLRKPIAHVQRRIELNEIR
jgi:hypothetical protein